MCPGIQSKSPLQKFGWGILTQTNRMLTFKILVQQLWAFGLILLFLEMPAAQFYTYTEHFYTPSDELFPNPERGFSAFRTSWLSAGDLQSLRLNNISLIQRIHTMPQFNNGPISDSYLQNMEQDFIIARENGVKFLLRFSYTNSQSGADAPLQVILEQLDQLEPLFHQYYDVIAYVEAGFIGAWGEWYYSSNGLNNTDDRRSVLYKILDVLPLQRMAAVRTPGYKRAIFQTNDPLDYGQAFNQTRRARTGAHNDCFLASINDYGTYSDVESDKTYLNLDNRFVVQGGETCNPSAYSGCVNALDDLERLHYSQLNSNYNMNVLDGWESEGCMPEIKRRLGYRLQLQRAFIQDDARPGGIFELDLDIYNEGFASPYNPRLLEILLQNQDSGEFWILISDEDPRLWMTGDTAAVTISGGLPEHIPQGQYQVWANLPDPAPNLHDRQEFAIRLGNEGLWDAATGYHDLGHVLNVSNSVLGAPYGGTNIFVPLDSLDLKLNELNLLPDQPLLLTRTYPNPFNGNTTIQFEMQKPGSVELIIHDLQGRLVHHRNLGWQGAGDHSVNWDPLQSYASGIYYLTLISGQLSVHGKCLYLK